MLCHEEDVSPKTPINALGKCTAPAEAGALYCRAHRPDPDAILCLENPEPIPGLECHLRADHRGPCAIRRPPGARAR